MATCPHTKAASQSLLESYALGVRLAIAAAAGHISPPPSCAVCGSVATPIACLECGLVGCPEHRHDHSFGVCILPSSDGELWCWECDDVVIDMKYERIRRQTVKSLLHPDVDGVQDNKSYDGVFEGLPASSGRSHGLFDGSANRASHGPVNGSLNGSHSGISKNSQNEKANGSSQLVRRVPYHAHMGLKGFVNMGATCYMSVVLQALIHNPLIRTWFLAGGHANQLCDVPQCVACCVDRVYCDFFSSSSVTGYGMADLLVAAAHRKPSMGAGATEQDAHEFLHFLLNELHQAATTLQAPFANEVGAKSDHPLDCQCVAHRNFAGELQSTLECTCGSTRRTNEPLIDVSLDVSQHPQGTTLKESLHRFTEAEPVRYTCPQCGQDDTTTKQIKIARLSPVLCFQLKRFSHVSAGGQKIGTPVKFPLQIDLGIYTASQTPGLIYELYGVVYHQGSLDSGHYTCVMKHAEGGWFRFDDTEITMADVGDIPHTNAYLLFYIVKWAVA